MRDYSPIVFLIFIIDCGTTLDSVLIDFLAIVDLISSLLHNIKLNIIRSSAVDIDDKLFKSFLERVMNYLKESTGVKPNYCNL